MPGPDQIDPMMDRRQSAFETDSQYAERMARLDQREAYFKALATQVWNLDEIAR